MFLCTKRLAVPASEVLYVEFEGAAGSGVCGHGGECGAVIHTRGGRELPIHDPEDVRLLRAALKTPTE